jgi:23S rRNA (uracil1939-C5)-methyltransferase
MPTCAAAVPKWCRHALNIGLLNQQVWRLPASAHDARLLVDAGYRPLSVEVLDLFTHTHHVEVVSSFERAS